MIVLRLDLEREVLCRTLKLCDLRLAEVVGIEQHQPLALPLTVVTETAGVADPHVPQQPIGWVLCIAIHIELPKHSLEAHSRRGVLGSLFVMTWSFLWQRIMRFLIAGVQGACGRSLHGVHCCADELVLERLGASLALLPIHHKQASREEIQEIWIKLCNALGQRSLLDVAEPLHEEKAGLSVRAAVAHEACICWHEDGIE
mmetsp:Transcript_7026/g.15389  ORF Transcript_7026/g.15389 Transcript_7026/m.15389 type:complete len:201 (-) Transcript_7026:915-1517(-)